jgi:hypothetical protein
MKTGRHIDDAITVYGDEEKTNLTDIIHKIQSDLSELRSTLDHGNVEVKFDGIDDDKYYNSINEYINSITQIIKPYREKYSSLNIEERKKYSAAIDKLRDAVYIRKLGLVVFFGICMGESTHGGWTEDKPGERKFEKMTSVLTYKIKEKYCKNDFIPRRTSELSGIFSSEPRLLLLSKDILNVMPKKYMFDSSTEDPFSESLKSFFTKDSYLFRSNDKTIFGLLKLYAEYTHGKSIHNVFETTTNTLFENASAEFKDTLLSVTDLRNTGSITCKKLFCFALHYCMNLNPLETSGGGNFFGRVRPEQQVVAIDLDNRDNRSYWQKILVLTFSIMSLIFFTLLLFETFRLLNSTITRILDARVTYLALYGEGQERPEDTTFVGYMNSFLRVMYEVGAGNIIETLDSLTPSLMHEIQESLMTVATTATNEQYDICADGIWGCINSFFSAERQAHVQATTETAVMQEIDKAILSARYKLQAQINTITFTYRSGTRNLVTALHGISFSSILILNVLYPDTYTREIVGTSFSTLSLAYMINPLYGLYGLGGQLSLLMYPQFRGIRRGPPIDPARYMRGLRELQNLEALTADVLAQHKNQGRIEDRRGGKNRKTFKKRANKTVKKKYNKRKTSKK